MGPPVGKRWHTREDSGIRIDHELRWWHDDERIEHPKILEAFQQGLQPDDQGRYVLHFGNDWCYVQVEDAAYWVESLEPRGDALFLSLSDRSEEPLAPATLTVEPDGVLSCRVKQGRAKARFSRQAQFQLGEKVERADHGMVLRVGASEFPLSFDGS